MKKLIYALLMVVVLSFPAFSDTDVNVGFVTGLSWTTRSTTYTAGARDNIIADTSGGAFTITLPPSPSIGNTVTIIDGSETFSTYNLTILRNGSNINGQASDLVLNLNNTHMQLVYYNVASGWRILNMR